MKTLIVLCCLFATNALAGDVYVDGYVRKDGTYVAPYVRTSPDRDRENNYGSAYGTNSSPYLRDKDNDKIPNYLDINDND